MTFETVDFETPLSAATSMIVGRAAPRCGRTGFKASL
jgi:hypothetical protein